MRLAAPWVLIALLAVPVLAVLLAQWRRASPALAVPGIPRRYPSVRALAHGLAWPWRMACVALLIGALARPQWGWGQSQQVYHGIDIMVALDVSMSMWSDDMAPNRMEAAKVVTRRFLAGLGQDRVGLVLFSGEAETYCPLTTDLAALSELVGRVEVQMIVPTGTNLEAALLAAAARFRYDDSRSSVVILVTDGEQTVPGDPVEGARACAAKGVRVYTIGVGSPEGAYIRAPAELGGDILRGPRGPVLSRMDEPTLEDIARITGGHYWRAQSAGRLGEVFAAIAALEKGDIRVSRRMRYEERMAWLAWPAAALLVLDALIFGAWLRRTV